MAYQRKAAAISPRPVRTRKSTSTGPHHVPTVDKQIPVRGNLTEERAKFDTAAESSNADVHRLLAERQQVQMLLGEAERPPDSDAVAAHRKELDGITKQLHELGFE